MQKRAGALIIRNKALLLVTGHGSDSYWTPGGKIDGTDTPLETIKRELSEELGITVSKATLFDTMTMINSITGQEQTTTYFIVDAEGELRPDNEIAGFHWYTREDFDHGTPKISKNMRETTYPRLISLGLV